MLSNGDLTGISHQHLIGASKTGAFTGVAMVVAYLSFRRKLDSIYIKYLAIILTGVFACLGEHIARLTDTSAWPDGVDLQKSFLVGLGAALIALITEKYIFLFIQGLKSEPVVDINEMKMIGMQNKIVEGETVSVLLEKIEDKNGDVIVSAQKAKKIKGWYELEKAYEDDQSINNFECYSGKKFSPTSFRKRY